MNMYKDAQYNYHSLVWLKLKRLTMPNVGEYVEEQKNVTLWKV